METGETGLDLPRILADIFDFFPLSFSKETHHAYRGKKA